MDQFSNAPVMPGSTGTPGPSGWIQTWIKAVTQPNEQAYIEIAESPDARPSTAYLWVFIAATLTFVVSALMQALLTAMGLGSELQNLSSMTGGSVVTLLCLSPVIGGLAVLFFALGVAIIQWVAKLFRGVGTYDKLIYPIAAAYMPYSLVSMLLTPLSAIPIVGICVGLASMLVGFYYLFLQITAVKAVNRFGWGEAIGSVLIPGVVLIGFCVCCVIAGLTIMGPVIGDVFDQINQSLQYAP